MRSDGEGYLLLSGRGWGARAALAELIRVSQAPMVRWRVVLVVGVDRAGRGDANGGERGLGCAWC